MNTQLLTKAIEKTDIKESVTVDKPTINELIYAYVQMNQDMTAFEADKFNQEKVDIFNKSKENWENLSLKNERYLSLMTGDDINIVNINKLIASIELNGEKHFNMTTFMATLDRENMKSYFQSSRPIYELTGESLSGLTGEEAKIPVNFSTKTFNCDTVGCIAGFAAANATNWDEKLWGMAALYQNSMHDLMEHVACNFLNIPVQLGRQIFYGEYPSVWGFLYESSDETDELNMFNQLEIEDRDYYEESGRVSIELNSITHEHAAKALQLIRDKHIIADRNKNFGLIWSKQMKRKMGYVVD